MKNITKISMLLVFLMLMGSAVIVGQTPKLGHINSNELLALMPERDKAAKTVEAFAKDLEGQLSAMSAEYENKLQDYQSKQALMTDPVKQTKIQEITDLERRIQQFQLTAQESLQKKENQVLTPIIDKAKKAIEDVEDQ